jgi:hypothetical protein
MFVWICYFKFHSKCGFFDMDAAYPFHGAIALIIQAEYNNGLCISRNYWGKRLSRVPLELYGGVRTAVGTVISFLLVYLDKIMEEIGGAVR